MFVPVLEGKVAIASFLISVLFLLFTAAIESMNLWSICFEIIYVGVLGIFFTRFSLVKVILCSHIIGIVFAVGSMMLFSGQIYGSFGYYAMALSFFHISEYVLTSIFNSHTLTVDSFLINHSKEYGIAAVASWLEYWVELYFFPGLKSLWLISVIGAILVTFGESLRKVSMYTAGSNFSHIVQYRKRDSHKLVTHGIYSLFRHPSYVGWFYWSLGTQLLLCNPFCTVAYTITSWLFFKERIYDEEESLVSFFGKDYIEYKTRVSTGIPFIEGYPMDKAKYIVEYVINTK